MTCRPRPTTDLHKTSEADNSMRMKRNSNTSLSRQKTRKQSFNLEHVRHGQKPTIMEASGKTDLRLFAGGNFAKDDTYAYSIVVCRPFYEERGRVLSEWNRLQYV